MTNLATVEADPGIDNVVVFQNLGLIDIRAVTTMGVCSKDKASPIGYFGTGLKYAIAVLLRNGLKVTLYRGAEHYIFESKTTKIRNDNFDLVHMNGKELGFTTGLGRNWELWQAFRELYSNTLDENGTVFTENNLHPSEPEHTTIVVEGEAFVEIYENRSEVFIDEDEEVLTATEYTEVYKGPSEKIFYRGIRVGEYDKPFKYKYNVKDYVTLTEDRTVQYHFQIMGIILNGIATSTDKKYIKSIVTAGDSYQEGKLDFTEVSLTASNEFNEVMAELKWEKNTRINSSALSFYDSNLDLSEKVVYYEMLPNELLIFNEVQEFVKYLGCDFTDMDVCFVETLGDKVDAMHEQDKIFLSKYILDKPIKEQIKILYLQMLTCETSGSNGDWQSVTDKLISKVVGMAEQLKKELK